MKRKDAYEPKTTVYPSWRPEKRHISSIEFMFIVVIKGTVQIDISVFIQSEMKVEHTYNHAGPGPVLLLVIDIH